MSLSQEEAPEGTPAELKEYLGRRFLDIATLLDQASKFPQRKQMPYKPQFGDEHYFGDPATHQYDPVINLRGWWGFQEILPATDPRTGSWELLSVKGILDVVFLISIEEVIMAKFINESYADGATIDDYASSKAIDPLANITEDLVAGTITIGVDGWYALDGYIEATGSSNNAFYGVQFNIVGSINDQFIIGIAQWTNTNPGISFSAGLKLPLEAGDVISMIAFASGGTLDVETASLSISMESL